MKALYSLVCRLRTLYALTQGTVTLVCDGWAALTPAQGLLLGCGLCILLRVLASPSCERGKHADCVNSFLGVAAAFSVVVLSTESLVDAGLLLGGLAFGV